MNYENTPVGYQTKGVLRLIDWLASILEKEDSLGKVNECVDRRGGWLTRTKRIRVTLM